MSKIQKYFLLILSSLMMIFFFNFDTFSISIKKTIHKENLENSPFKKTYNLSGIHDTKLIETNTFS